MQSQHKIAESNPVHHPSVTTITDPIPDGVKMELSKEIVDPHKVPVPFALALAQRPSAARCQRRETQCLHN